MRDPNPTIKELQEALGPDPLDNREFEPDDAEERPSVVREVQWSYSPHPRQQLFHRNPSRFKLYGGAMGGGKSVALCAEAVLNCLEYPGNRGLLCRYENATFKRTTYKSLLRLIPWDFVVQENQTEQCIYFHNGSELLYGGLKASSSTSSEDRIKSMDLGFICLDEASEIPKELYLMLLSRLRWKLADGTNPPYPVLLASNPEPGWVKEEFVDKKLPDHVFITALPTDNPHLPQSVLDDMLSQFPVEWQKKYLEGDWEVALDASDCVYPYTYVRQAMERDLPPGDYIQLGVDLAAEGGDKTVVVGRFGNVCQILFRQRKMKTIEAEDKLRSIMDNLKPDRVLIDVVGLGINVYEHLRRDGYPVHKFVAGAVPRLAKEKNRFLNARAQAHWLLRERLLAGEISLPDDMELRSQLPSIKWKVHGERKIQIESKKDMRRRGMASPNEADALMMAWAEPTSGSVQVHTARDLTARKTKGIGEDTERADLPFDAEDKVNALVTVELTKPWSGHPVGSKIVITGYEAASLILDRRMATLIDPPMEVTREQRRVVVQEKQQRKHLSPFNDALFR